MLSCSVLTSKIFFLNNQIVLASFAYIGAQSVYEDLNAKIGPKETLLRFAVAFVRRMAP